jgi:hypothetical protein
MASKNDITGDWIKSKPNSEQFEENFDKIFRKENVDPIKKPFPHNILKQSNIDYEYELNKSTGEVERKDL